MISGRTTFRPPKTIRINPTTHTMYSSISPNSTPPSRAHRVKFPLRGVCQIKKEVLLVSLLESNPFYTCIARHTYPDTVLQEIPKPHPSRMNTESISYSTRLYLPCFQERGCSCMRQEKVASSSLVPLGHPCTRHDL